MAFANFSLSTAYATIISMLNTQLISVAKLFRNQTTGDFADQVRYSSTNKRLEYWTGSAWTPLDLSATVIAAATTATTATTATNATTHIADTTGAVHGATNANTANMIVRRDASGGFSAGPITAYLNGNCSGSSSSCTGNAATATNATTHIADATGAVHGATSAATVNAIVRRNASGGFSAGPISATFFGNLTGNVTGNATTATNATTHIADTTGAVHGATNANTANMIVRRDASGGFSAGTITAYLNGNCSGSSSSCTGNAATATQASSVPASGITGVLSTATLPAGVQIGYASVTSTARVTCSGTIPKDGTVPQLTEGSEILSLSYTPKSATSKLVITAVLTFTKQTHAIQAIALFVNTVNNALAAATIMDSDSGQSGTYSTQGTITLRKEVPAGSTGARTYSVRGELGLYINGGTASQLLGGAETSLLTVQEIL